MPALPRALSRILILACSACLSLLAGCDQLGLETPQVLSQKKEAEAKAVGAGCRQTGRAIEDCYAINPKASKAAVFTGWREMDEYMRENKLEIVPSTIAASAPPAAKKPAAEADDEPDTAASAAKPEGKRAAGEAKAGKAEKKPPAEH